MTPAVLHIAEIVAREHFVSVEELTAPGKARVRPELARARHRWRSLVATSLGYGEPDGAQLAELARLLKCDRKTLWASLRAVERTR